MPEANAAAANTVLFVGAGRIGMPMLLRLMEKGIGVHAADASPDSVAELELRGVRALRPAEISRLSYKRVLLCLPDPGAAKTLISRWIERGLLAGAIIGDITTMSPSTARHHARLVADAGGAYLDVPVSGGQRGAESGKMVVLAGGSAEHFEAMRPILEALGDPVHHVGAVGTASQVKAVHQHVYLSFNLAFATGLRLGRELGLPEHVVMDVLTKGAAQHALINDRVPTAIGSGFRNGFILKRCLKDLECLELPEGLIGPARDAHEQLTGHVRAAVEASMGELDILALSGMTSD